MALPLLRWSYWNEGMDNAMIKDLLDAGMKIGSQGMDHRDWRTVAPFGHENRITQRPVTTVANFIRFIRSSRIEAVDE